MTVEVAEKLFPYVLSERVVQHGLRFAPRAPPCGSLKYGELLAQFLRKEVASRASPLTELDQRRPAVLQRRHGQRPPQAPGGPRPHEQRIEQGQWGESQPMTSRPQHQSKSPIDPGSKSMSRARTALRQCGRCLLNNGCGTGQTVLNRHERFAMARPPCYPIMSQKKRCGCRRSSKYNPSGARSKHFLAHKAQMVPTPDVLHNAQTCPLPFNIAT